MSQIHERPDPDALLHALKKEEENASRGKLKIFFGMCAGVGKTYEMLKAAHEAKSKGIDVLVGYIETHKRPETQALLDGLTILPRKRIAYRGAFLEEMDIDSILKKNPPLVLVDELAHTNAPGSRHTKRYQDVEELLDNGIDVYTTLNVQHLESRSETVAQITGTLIRETVPDSIFGQATEVEIIDIPPDELLKRLAEGKVYTSERSQQAIQHFFRKGNLTALREMSLRMTAERVDHQLREFMTTQHITRPWKSIQRLLVGITASAESLSLIRWARRMAYTMNASWMAVYVETSKPVNETVREQLAKNLSLARELGAEVLTTADEDIVQGLLRIAKQQNVTQILIGKPAGFFPFRKSLLDRLIERSGDLDIYVVGGTDESGKKRFWHLPEIHSGLPQYAAAVFAILAFAAICYPLRQFVGYQTISLILLFIVAALPLKLGTGPVIISATLSALVWNYFFIPPQFTFAIKQPQDILMFTAYFVVAAVTGVLTTRVRAREQAVRVREERATALYTLTNDLSSANSQNDVIRAAITNIKKFFNADVVVFLSELDGDFLNKPHPKSTYVPDEKELSVSAWVHWNEKHAGKFTETLPFAAASYFPLSGPRYPLGVIGINIENRFTLDQEILFRNFISQISTALDREFLNEMTKKSVALAESERLYTTLFNSISHEMRTPITALLSASESLSDETVAGQTELRKRLSHEIQSAAERLDQIVQNLLDMTRLESGLIQPKLDWCDIHDIINSVLKKLQSELLNREVTINIPASVPLIKLDFVLIEQALMNLLRNAARYTPEQSPVMVTVSVSKTTCKITISDKGPGFPKESVGKVFEKFYRVPGSKTNGIGLGLSIALGFVQAHNGTLTLENNPGGGATFTIQLPVPETETSINGALDEQ